MKIDDAIRRLRWLAIVRSQGYFEHLSNGGEEDPGFKVDMEAFDFAIKTLEEMRGEANESES